MRRHRLGEQVADWDTRTELQAATVDMLQLLLRAQVENPPPFEPVKRPYEPRKARAEAKGVNELRTFLEGI